MTPYNDIKLGGLQDCNREAIFRSIDTFFHKDLPFSFVEVGVAKGETFFGIINFIKRAGFGMWSALGVDLDGGPWGFIPPPVPVNEDIRITVEGSVNFFRRCHRGYQPINFLHIDGCHSIACCTQDFVLAEPHIAPGGVVAIHDADIHCQGPEFDVQPHCGRGIGVREALHCLGLLDGSRPGWKLLYDIEGSEEPGPSFGRGSVLVRKEPFIA